jgi:hypothetical protein
MKPAPPTPGHRHRGTRPGAVHSAGFIFQQNEGPVRIWAGAYLFAPSRRANSRALPDSNSGGEQKSGTTEGQQRANRGLSQEAYEQKRCAL